MSRFASDYIGSDDADAMGAILDQSRLSVASGSTAVASSSSSASTALELRDLKRKIRDLDADIDDLDKQIMELRQIRQKRLDEKKRCQEDIDKAMKGPRKSGASKTNYDAEDFPWSRRMRMSMENTFNIKNYRLCQLAVCNANMDRRDIVCVMPTGGGKSLTYQLPAIQGAGCTLVISPLISLITDQIMHLRQNGISAVKLTGSTTKEENKEIIASLLNLGNNRNPIPERKISLCYVTPEKISKNKSFQSILQKVADNNKLDRIVIDEAHCVSQMGHDFRPDYKELRLLRKLFPDVPIMALTATCPPQVLQDLISILGLGKICDANSLDGTVYFDAPLYRPNLHYKALAKPSNAKQCLKLMTEWILEHHPTDCGIVYCLSRKDTETVAKELQQISNGKIRTGFYHADKQDADKERLHAQWHKGIIKVVCATIAFGMGIDKSDVRFVIHHSISKSLDGFYQESGRAGRDGKDSDCITYYRPQDAWTLAGMNDRTDKLFPMINFVQDTKQCRKLQFAKYFSHSSNLALTAWGDNALKECGHCDNCQRPEGSAEERDVTFASWQILKLVAEVCKPKSAFTAAKIATLAKTGKIAASGKTKVQEEVDLDKICGGKVDLDKEDLEFLLVYLWTENYLNIRYQQTSYNTLVYIATSPMAYRITNMSKEQAQTEGSGARIRCSFTVRQKGRRKGKGKKVETEAEYMEFDEDDVFADDDEEDEPRPPKKTAKKRKSDVVPLDEDGEEERRAGPSTKAAGKKKSVVVVKKRKSSGMLDIEIPDSEDDLDSDDIEDGGDEWSFSLRPGRSSQLNKKQKTREIVVEDDIIEIDSD